MFLLKDFGSSLVFGTSKSLLAGFPFISISICVIYIFIVPIYFYSFPFIFPFSYNFFFCQKPVSIKYKHYFEFKFSLFSYYFPKFRKCLQFKKMFAVFIKFVWNFKNCSHFSWFVHIFRKRSLFENFAWKLKLFLCLNTCSQIGAFIFLNVRVFLECEKMFMFLIFCS